MKSYGQFQSDSYKIISRNQSVPAYNILFGENYIAKISQVGAGNGFVKDSEAGLLPLLTDRAVYIFDGERAWQANALPVQKTLQHYHCIHHYGATEIEISNRSVKTNCFYFASPTQKCEYLKITIKNDSRQAKTLQIIPYYDTDIDKYSSKTAFSNYNEEKNSVIGRCRVFNKNNVPVSRFVYLSADQTVTGFDTSHNAFIGPYGHKLQPKAIVENGGCSQSKCFGNKLCFALQNTVTLAAGESTTFYYAFGISDAEESILPIAAGKIENQLVLVRENYEKQFSTLRIHTPWKEANDLSNHWLKLDTLLGAYWSNIFERNELQTQFSACECLSSFSPSLAGDLLCKSMNSQFESGHFPAEIVTNQAVIERAPHTALWSIFATFSITKELGDVDFLMQRIPFNNGTSATLYEHVKRAVSFLWKHTGHMGLIRIDGGDWNELIDGAGYEGKGVSVFTSIAFVRAAKMLSQMANWIGSSADSKASAYYAQEMEKRVYQYAWDEDRYIYAISDDKTLIGAKESAEGNMFALPQIWSVLAEFEDKERQKIIFNTLKKSLVSDKGLLTSAPPYAVFTSQIGTLTATEEKNNKNGGFNLENAVWKLMADALLQDNDSLESGLRSILPSLNGSLTEIPVPYALPEYYTDSGEYGSYWNSKAGPALLFCLVRFVYGLTPEFGGLKIKPCLPSTWKDCSISKVFRSCRYNIHYIQKDKGVCNTIDSIYVNGIQLNPALPIRPQAGKTLNVEVILRT